MVHKKPIYRRGGDCLKRGAWSVCRFKGGLGKKEGVVFLRGWVHTPMHTMIKIMISHILLDKNGGINKILLFCN